MAAVRHQGCKTICIYLILSQPLLIQTNHIGQVATGGMAGDENLVAITPVALDLPVGPSHRCRRIVDAVAQRGLRQQAIIDRYHGYPFFLQLFRHKLIA